jgi:hypothetical protein
MQHIRVLRTLKGSVPERFRVSTLEVAGEAHAFSPLQGEGPRLYLVNGGEESKEGAEPTLLVEEIALDDAEDLAVFVDRITEAQQLRAKGASEEEERAWLVRCAMRRATRGHAVHALVTESRKLPKGREPQLAKELTQAQRRAILDGFRQEPTTDGTFAGVLALGRGVPHAAFDRVAVGAMETLLTGPEGGMSGDAPHALYLLMERLGVPDFEERWHAARQLPDEPEIAEDYLRLQTAAHRQMRALWEALRAEGHLVPAPYVQPAWSSVDRISLSAD